VLYRYSDLISFLFSALRCKQKLSLLSQPWTTNSDMEKW